MGELYSLILALATVTAQAQLTDWQNISSKNFVMKIIHETMLVGGIEYLYAFDGKKCTAVYDINPLSPYSYVKKIRADRDGRIWVACYDALNR